MGLQFQYHSKHVEPQVLIHIEKGVNEYATTAPDRIGFKASFASQVQETIFEGSLDYSRFKALFEAKNGLGDYLLTGLYAYTVNFDHYHAADFATASCFSCPPLLDLDIPTAVYERFSYVMSEPVPVVNQRSSPFGAGWSLAGLKRLYFDSLTESILLVDGNGDSIPFYNGEIITYAGSGETGNTGDGDLAIYASTEAPLNIGMDDYGNLYTVSEQSHVIRRIDTQGFITTIAGNGNNGYSGDGGPARDAEIGRVNAIEVAPSGNHLYQPRWL